jgi:hypothetical protein
VAGKPNKVREREKTGDRRPAKREEKTATGEVREERGPATGEVTRAAIRGERTGDRRTRAAIRKFA